jgi:exodeoxyribonuclease-3
MGRGISTTLDYDDAEGRMLHTYHNGIHCLNCYLPSGSSGDERQYWKEAWMDDLLEWARPFTELDEPVFLCGDLNVAHTEDDIWNPTGNRGTSGFLPQERAWFDRLLESGWNDLFRIHEGQPNDSEKIYSWWSNRGQARQLDRGWRIDYVLSNAAGLPLLNHAEIKGVKELNGISDHAPVIVDLDI